MERHPTEVDRIADQLQKAFFGGAWHGPAMFEILPLFTSNMATSRPIPSAHTTWEIVLHLITAYKVIITRLEGNLGNTTDAEDWPCVLDSNEAAWQRDLSSLQQLHKELVHKIAQLPDSVLNQAIVSDYSSIYRTLHGHIQHILYHTGQIALLRKASAN